MNACPRSQNTRSASYAWFGISLPLLLAYPWLMAWRSVWSWLPLMYAAWVLGRTMYGCWRLWEVVLEKDALVVRAIFRRSRQVALGSFTGFTPSGRFNPAVICFSDGPRHPFAPKLKTWAGALEYTPEDEFLAYWTDEITERAAAPIIYG